MLSICHPVTLSTGNFIEPAAGSKPAEHERRWFRAFRMWVPFGPPIALSKRTSDGDNLDDGPDGLVSWTRARESYGNQRISGAQSIITAVLVDEITLARLICMLVRRGPSL